jgi:hypothetical protein
VVPRGIEIAVADQPDALADFHADADSVTLHLAAGRPLTLHLTVGERLPSDWIAKMNGRENSSRSLHDSSHSGYAGEACRAPFPKGGLVAQRLEQRTHNRFIQYCYHWFFNTLQAIGRAKSP